MKYFIDTEFIEGKQDKTFLGIKVGETKPTIDLISIGIVSEEKCNLPRINDCDKENPCRCCSRYNQKEYYAISKDFNLKAAWNNELVRENVLRQIYQELDKIYYTEYSKSLKYGISSAKINCSFTFNNVKYLLNRYGKTNKQIAQEVLKFIGNTEYSNAICTHTATNPSNIEFYGYYSDYDWVVFCQLFGTMMDLPKGFPMYCNDLKQELDRKVYYKANNLARCSGAVLTNTILDNTLNSIKEFSSYPKQINEHNALADAMWNYELFKFLNTLRNQEE